MKLAVLPSISSDRDNVDLNARLPKALNETEATNNPLGLLRAYQNEKIVIPFTPHEVCRTTNQDRKLLNRLLRRAEKNLLSNPEAEALARLSLDFEIDRTLIDRNKIGVANSDNIRSRRIEIIKKTSHRGIARYELDDQTLFDALKLQDRTISASKLSKSIHSFPKSEQALALLTLSIASSFSSIHSLFQISTHPSLHGMKIFRMGSGSISESFKYLNKKSPSDFTLKFTNKFGPDTCIILDPIAVKKIAENPNLQKQILSLNVRLILPVGLDNGISVFGSSKLSSENIACRTKKIMEEAENDLSKQGLTSPTQAEKRNAIMRVIASPVLQKLPEEILKRVELVTSQSHESTLDISKNLAGPRHISSVEQVASLILSVPGNKEELDLFRDYLIRNISYFSDLKIAETLNRLASNLEQLRENKGIAFYLPKEPNAQETKSYHLMINLFIRTLGIENPIIIEGAEDLRSFHRNVDRGKTPAVQLVLIDDFAGTGASLFTAYEDIRKVYKGDLAICTLATTDKAIMLNENEESFVTGFRGFVEIEAKDPKFHYIPGETVNRFDSSTLKHYSEEEQLVLYSMSGTLGYGNIGTCAMFPYMTPNNNISAVEPFSICFTNGVGVKNTTRTGSH